jgi:ABC-type uncharacterized transport system fused permease/ATPase subunit
MDGKTIMKAVTLVMAVIILVLVSALIVGTLLAQTVFSSLTLINTTWIGEQFGLFVTALLGFLAVIGVIIAIVWLIGYIKPLFSKGWGRNPPTDIILKWLTKKLEKT